MYQVALILFHGTFEDRQELRTTEEPENEDPKQNIGELNIIHLLPSAFAWIKEAGTNLIQLSEVSWNDCPSIIG